MNEKDHLPDRINVDRLMRFPGTGDSLELNDMEDQVTLDNLQLGSYVAYVSDKRVVLLKVTGIQEDESLTGWPMTVPDEEQFGGSHRRPWQVHDEEELKVLWDAILCIVDLDETGCLTNMSLERLRKLGVELAGGELAR